MKPLSLVAVFLVGLILGFVFANEEHATAAAWSTARIVELGARVEACAAANAQWQAVATMQESVLDQQQAALRKVGPIVRRAYPLWPWGAESGLQPEMAGGVR